MLALITPDSRPTILDVDNERFSSALTVSSDDDSLSNSSSNEELHPHITQPFLAVSATNKSGTLQLSHSNENSPRLSPEGILELVNHCGNIRELSMSYSLLSDDLLKALSSIDGNRLETLRVEAHPETKPHTYVSPEAWLTFSGSLPNVNLVLLTYLVEESEYDKILAPHVPITHLYFGENAPASVIERVSLRSPRLSELVIGAYGPDTVDEVLISAAKGCPRLSAVGLGDCELTCSTFVEFVSLCRNRLQVLHIWETSLLEDSKFTVSEVSAEVSKLLGRNWQPEYVPFW